MSIRCLPMLGLLWAMGCCLGACATSEHHVVQWDRVVKTTWILTTIDKRPPLVGNDGSAQPLTLEFSGDGRAVGFTGVNRFFGRYESSSEGRLRFAALGSTRMFRDDPPGLMDQEQQLLSTLGEIDRFRLRGGKLALFSGKQKRLVYVPALLDHGDQTGGKTGDTAAAATRE